MTTFNTLGGTADAELLRSFLESEQPDLLVLQEYSTSLDRQLLPDTMFAYRSDEGVSNLQPVVLFSRFPILDVSAVPPAGSVRGQGITRIALSVDGLEVILFAVHATTPRRGERDWLERNAILDALGNRIAEEPEGTIVIAAGDFNTPPWSPYFRHLAATGSVTATSGAFLPPATRIIDRGWLPALFGSPVDHILVSENIAWAPHRVGPNLGSDHRPVTADLYLQAN